MGAFTVGQIARRAGLKPSAVRYYERHRVIPPAQRLPNGYRVYSEDTLRWLNFIRRAQAFGMSLKNVKELLQLVRHGQMPCPRVRELAQQKLAEIDQSMRDLQELRRHLEQLLRRRPAGKGARHLCPLIED